MPACQQLRRPACEYFAGRTQSWLAGEAAEPIETATESSDLSVEHFPGVLAQVYATLGEKDRAFYWLEEYGQHHNLTRADPTKYFKTDPWFAPIRSDPQFSDFLSRVGLPP